MPADLLQAGSRRPGGKLRKVAAMASGWAAGESEGRVERVREQEGGTAAGRMM